MNAGDAHLILFTLAASALAVALALPPATALAWLMARRSWRGKLLVETLATLPLVMPPVATGLVLLKLTSRNSPLGRWLHDATGIELVFTWKAVVLTLAVMAFPLLFRSIRTAIEEVPRHLEEAGTNLGQPPWRGFFHLTLPLARRGIAAGTFLAFARALGEFGATAMVAGFIPGITETLPLAIYRSVQLGDDTRALTLAAVSTTIAFFAVWLSTLLSSKR